MIEVSLSFKFSTINIQTEYEAVMVEITLVEEVGA